MKKQLRVKSVSYIRNQIEKGIAFKKKYLAPFVVVLLTIGCANVGPKFSADTVSVNSNVGTVIFYRPHQFLGGLDFRWLIEGNGKKITALKDSTYSIVKLPPGRYHFHARTPRIDTVEPIEIQEGTIQYIRVSQAGASYWTYILLKEKDETEALSELKELSMQINRDKWAQEYQYSRKEIGGNENNVNKENGTDFYPSPDSVDSFDSGDEYYSPQDTDKKQTY
ncbi:MAG: hypothetical protein KAH20_10410 [Methylococcales bacterium]|nr:hypothetical protein [Methylococcales bacterium]